MITRFAPSPTGPLHLGHAYSAILAHDMARAAGGQFLLRIEDIDQTRARPAWEAQIADDLAWLGLTWDGPVLRQSQRMSLYYGVIDDLWRKGHLYICTCTRRDIHAALSAPQEGGPDGPIYPGTCKGRRSTAATPPRDAVLRFDLDTFTDQAISFQNNGLRVDVTLDDLRRDVGDFVIGRKDSGTSYHLSVVIDDAAQDITDVVRGADLAAATQIHVALQRVLGLPTPRYHHHDLIRDAAGKRLAKRDDAKSIAKFRAEGISPAGIRQMVGLAP
ncbi:tRNA glutamyl-Q(34) synthetase GluQRS [Yoonia vestfoldensis]|uniref:Glutamate--tRNA ligase n=1 Tax=Yoonia vestfoldensis TaxID=245188 RepID=A0A1Y0EAZ4_9RHOB|nr:tRNA glutamyl-Q(34) synthetase GluQRS [Yoonia vestfoldensis]ARU00786.1 glutamate--tRNA ligase [Yoonia vestfoldensis]